MVSIGPLSPSEFVRDISRLSSAAVEMERSRAASEMERIVSAALLAGSQVFTGRQRYAGGMVAVRPAHVCDYAADCSYTSRAPASGARLRPDSGINTLEVLVVRRVLLAILAGAVVLSACSSNEEAPVEEVAPVEEAPVEEAPEAVEEPVVPDGEPSPLTGEPLTSEQFEQPMLMVKVDNDGRSRPQSGLEAADIVLEEVVEGGVTRFLAFLHSELPRSIGPVRSGRPVDAELLHAFGRSVFAYSGARPEVLAMLAATPAVKMADPGGANNYSVYEFQPAWSRSRERAEAAANWLNLFMHPNELIEEAMRHDPDPVPDIGWVFSEDIPDGADECPPGAASCVEPGAEIRINMSTSYYTRWEYDEEEGVYRRFQNQWPFYAADPEQFGVQGERTVGAANVVILGARHYIGASGYPETDSTTPAEGTRAVILRDGLRYEAVWVRPEVDSPILLQTPDGQPFPLKPGRTWLHLPSTTNIPAPIS